MNEMLGKSSSDLKNQRLRLLLDEIGKNGTISRAQFHQASGMALPTITRLMQEFLNSGILIEKEKGQSSGGRQPALLSLTRSWV